MRIVLQRRRAEEQDVASERGDRRDGPVAGFAGMARRTPQPLRLVHHQQVDPRVHGLRGQLRLFDELLERDHGSPMNVERIETRTEVPLDVGQPRTVEQREDLVIFAPQLAQPLNRQRLGRRDEAALDPLRVQQPVHDQRRLDGLAEPDLVGQQPAYWQPHRRALGHVELVREQVHASAKEGAEAIGLAGRQQVKHLEAGQEAVGLVALAGREPFEWGELPARGSLRFRDQGFAAGGKPHRRVRKLHDDDAAFDGGDAPGAEFVIEAVGEMVPHGPGVHRSMVPCDGRPDGSFCGRARSHGSISGDVDNVTHAFVGAAMAECAVPPGAPSRTRTILIAAGVIAANAPDVDLLYTGITEAPLGYLLHHRGHSHTLPGLAVLGLAIWSGLRVLPGAKAALLGMNRRVVVLIAAALLGHLLMDSANSYGTHPLYPLSARWIYGDAVFVLEPWLWLIIGAALASNAVRLWRAVVVLLALAPPAALVAIGLLPVGVVAVMLGVTAALAFAARDWDRKKRAAVVLVTAATIFVVMPAVSRLAKDTARRALYDFDRGELVDIVSDVNPGVPWCWGVLTLQKAADGPDQALVARRGTLSLLPGLWPAVSCASARLMNARWPAVATPSNAIVWHRQWRINLEELRTLQAGNCRVRAWLQFGRVPHVADGMIADLRFEHPVGQNFTPMAIDSGAPGCPSFVTNWERPRRDVLLPAADSP